MPEQAPNIDIKPGKGGRLVYDKKRRTIVADGQENTELERLRVELAEADRAAGAALRRVAQLEEEKFKRTIWLRDAKVSEGYSDDISFDVVWANIRAERDRLKALVASDPVKADTDRLDWLDRVNKRANDRNGSKYGWKFDINHNRAALTDSNIPALSVRTAIDTARQRSSSRNSLCN